MHSAAPDHLTPAAQPTAGHRGSGGRCRGMFGRAPPGGTENRPGPPAPASASDRAPPAATDGNPDGADPARKSTI
ncbi:hypothetical protein RM812_38905, partial [Streptomyces sp. DSM 40712]|nr:hypothetical protein [Streptomyces sp. DSM 40712]